ncbi:MAG TPA: GAF domain-containing protein [Myxococcota bacterium]|jgi:hypothetical protein
MSLFEVFIPGKDAGSPNVTLTLEAPNWIGALRSGLKSIGEGQESIANVMCDIKEDNSIHVTDVATRRVFRLREVKAEPKTDPKAEVHVDQGPRPISMPDAPAVDDTDTLRNVRPPEMTVEAPRTLIEFPAPQFDPPPAAKPAPALVVAKPGVDMDTSVPWTKMPAPDAKAPDARAMLSPAAPAPASSTRSMPAPVTAMETPGPFSRATPARGVRAEAPHRNPNEGPTTANMRKPVVSGSMPAPTAVNVEEPSTMALSASALRAGVPAPAPASTSAPTPRGVPAPAPKRPSGQFHNAPEPRTRETTKPNTTDPKIGRVTEKPSSSTSVHDAIAAVFDATQDLYLESALTAQTVADKLLDIALKHVPAEAGTFYLADVNGHELTFAAVRGPKADALKRSGMTVPVGQGIIGFCAQEGVCLAVSDIQKDPRFLASIAKTINYQPKDTLCSSAEKDGRLYGALQLINSTRGFDAAHMEVLRFIGLTAAAMLERVAERS